MEVFSFTCVLCLMRTHTFPVFLLSLVTAETVDVILMLSTPVHVCDVACCYTGWMVVALDLCSSISGHASVVGDEGQAFRHRAFLQGKHCWSMALWSCCCDVAHFSFWWLQLIGWSFCHFWGDRWGGVDYSATFGGGGGNRRKTLFCSSVDCVSVSSLWGGVKWYFFGRSMGWARQCFCGQSMGRVSGVSVGSL